MTLVLLAGATALPAGTAAAGPPLPPLPSPVSSLPLPTLEPSLPLPSPLPTVLPSLPLPTLEPSLPLPTVEPSLPLPSALPTVLPSLPLPTVLPSLPLPTAVPTAPANPMPSSPPDGSIQSAQSNGPSTPAPIPGAGSVEATPAAIGGSAGTLPPTSSPFEAFVLPGLLLGIPLLVVLLIVGIEAAGGAAWVPVIRRWVNGGAGWPGDEH
jgi:hypothetical protein